MHVFISFVKVIIKKTQILLGDARFHMYNGAKQRISMTLKIAIDLDNTVFNTAIMIRDICARNGVDFNLLTSYDPYECVPKHVADEIMGAFDSPELRKIPVAKAQIPELLNQMATRDDIEMYFITERPIAMSDMDVRQIQNAGIICNKKQVVNHKPKIEALCKYGIDLCFDDSPNIVCDCIANNIDIVMISNPDTPYNHHLRDRVEYYPDLVTALTRRNIIK